MTPRAVSRELRGRIFGLVRARLLFGVRRLERRPPQVQLFGARLQGHRGEALDDRGAPLAAAPGDQRTAARDLQFGQFERLLGGVAREPGAVLWGFVPDLTYKGALDRLAVVLEVQVADRPGVEQRQRLGVSRCAFAGIVAQPGHEPERDRTEERHAVAAAERERVEIGRA